MENWTKTIKVFFAAYRHLKFWHICGLQKHTKKYADMFSGVWFVNSSDTCCKVPSSCYDWLAAASSRLSCPTTGMCSRQHHPVLFLQWPSFIFFLIYLFISWFGNIEHLLLITDRLLLEMLFVFEVILKISVVGSVPLENAWPQYKTNSEWCYCKAIIF